jgi:anhydro-N-acetylmuramic acid kinase
MDVLCRLNARLAQEYASAVRAAVRGTPGASAGSATPAAGSATPAAGSATRSVSAASAAGSATHSVSAASGAGSATHSVSAASGAGVRLEDLDLVGCHGQTVRHHPQPSAFAGGMVASSFQIGNGSALAADLGVPVVWDFRSADIALGGQGAPLVPYVDHALLSSDTENRIALNLGGIANLTALPAGGGADEVVAFDTGPANMLIDRCCQQLFGLAFDRDGRIASRGRVSEDLLSHAMQDSFFDRPPPKSAGRKTEGGGDFGSRFAERFLRASEGLPGEDILATASMLTVTSISRAIEQFVPFAPDQILVSGGGVLNGCVMQGLRSRWGRVTSTEAEGLDPRYKEAIAFAVLAHEAANGVPTNLPRVTGASRRAILGAISAPCTRS